MLRFLPSRLRDYLKHFRLQHALHDSPPKSVKESAGGDFERGWQGQIAELRRQEQAEIL